MQQPFTIPPTYQQQHLWNLTAPNNSIAGYNSAFIGGNVPGYRSGGTYPPLYHQMDAHPNLHFAPPPQPPQASNQQQQQQTLAEVCFRLNWSWMMLFIRLKRVNAMNFICYFNSHYFRPSNNLHIIRTHSASDNLLWVCSHHPVISLFQMSSCCSNSVKFFFFACYFWSKLIIDTFWGNNTIISSRNKSWPDPWVQSINLYYDISQNLFSHTHTHK